MSLGVLEDLTGFLQKTVEGQADELDRTIKLEATHKPCKIKYVEVVRLLEISRGRSLLYRAPSGVEVRYADSQRNWLPRGLDLLKRKRIVT